MALEYQIFQGLLAPSGSLFALLEYPEISDILLNISRATRGPEISDISGFPGGPCPEAPLEIS